VLLRPVVLAAAAALALSGCSGSSSPGGAAPTAAASAAAPAVDAVASCPPAPEAGLTWPQEVPSDLPVPPGAQLTEVQDRQDGLTVVLFTTPISIRESVLFLIEALPAAGYTLARGDAENTEADAPFVKGPLRGVMRMIAVAPCRTEWLMAITTGPPSGGPGGGTPLLPPRPGASPLPFG
jgi:hypothetical protein